MKKVYITVLSLFLSVYASAQVFTIINESSCELDQKTTFAAAGVAVKSTPKVIFPHSSESIIVDYNGLYSGVDEYLVGSDFNVICNSKDDGVFSIKIATNKYSANLSSNSIDTADGNKQPNSIVLVDYKK
ncbi:MAG: hypothetical protein HON55_00265 [Legionellales bacterium]|jgi:hypothetical protein|nr:hypothetical protein [Legionellales bacterium]